MILIILAINKLWLIPIGIFLVYIFIYDKNKDELDGGEHLPKHDSKTQSQGYVRLHRHIRKTYTDYDLEIKKEPDEEGGGYTFIVEHWKRVWKVIFTQVPGEKDNQ